eukprot:4093828-Pyramimonas_sp.AAC.1
MRRLCKVLMVDSTVSMSSPWENQIRRIEFSSDKTAQQGLNGGIYCALLRALYLHDGVLVGDGPHDPRKGGPQVADGVLGVVLENAL